MLWLRLLWLAFMRRPVWFSYTDGGVDHVLIRYALPVVVVVRTGLAFGDEDDTTAIIPTDTILRVTFDHIECERTRLQAMWDADHPEDEAFDEDDEEDDGDSFAG